MTKRKVAERIDDLGEKIGGARKDQAVSTGPRKPRPRIEDTDPRPAWMRRYVAMEQIDRATQTGTGRWSLVDMGQNERYGGRTLMRDLPSEAAAEKAIPMAAVARNHRVRAVEGNQFEIWRDVTDRKRVKVISETFKSRDDAMRFMAENAVKIIETKTGFGEEILAKPEKVYRTGPEARRGDIAGQDFMKTLGARAVEFGNWQGERQSVMNHAYDALMDLSHVTGIAPKDLSLKGDLGIAFGARGHGLSSARAHYEPKYGAINLTKLDGAGALAHEWWHGMDHLLGRTDDPRLAELDPKSRTKAYREHLSNGVFASHRVDNPYAGKGQLDPAVRAAYKDLVDTIFRKPEQYTEDKAKAERFVAGTSSAVAEHLAALRKGLAQQLTYGKRNVKPATAAQLARFDAAAAKLQSGETGKMEWRSVSTKARPGNRFGGSVSRWSNPALEEISGVLKEVRGRSGFDSQNHHGPLDKLGAALRNHESRVAMMEQAAAQSVKTRMIPTEYAREAHKLDEGRVGDYWQHKHEMTARAFSAYVEDKLAAAGRRSDYLSFGSDNKYYALLGQKPFPEGAERQAINAKFDALFDAMRSSGLVKPGPVALPAFNLPETPATSRTPAPKPESSGLHGTQNAANLAAITANRAAEAKPVDPIEAVKNAKPDPRTNFVLKTADAQIADARARGLSESEMKANVAKHEAALREDLAESARHPNSPWHKEQGERARNDLALVQEVKTKMGWDKAAAESAKAPKPVKAPKPAKAPDLVKNAEKLAAVAQRALAAGEANLGRDRLANTARRARMAANAEGDARRTIGLANTALAIAERLKSGEAGPLSRVSTMADIEHLHGALRSAMYSAEKVNREGYNPNRTPQAADIAHARVEVPALDTYDINRMAMAVKDKPGTKRAIDKLTTFSRERVPLDSPEMREAARKLADLAAKSGNSSAKWAAKTVHERLRTYDRAEKLGLNSPEGLKAALTAYHEMRSGGPKADPIKAAERSLIGLKLPGFFPTPEPVAKRMAEIAGIKPGMSVLEPSAGTGRLADVAKAAGANVDVVEMQSNLREILAQKGHSLIDSDFTGMKPEAKYDRILMNPPFEKGQDMAHVQRAYEMLKPGGKMVAIMGEGGFFRSDAQATGFRTWLDTVGGTSEKLPEGTFKESGTGTNTRLVTISKPGETSGLRGTQNEANLNAIVANKQEKAKGNPESVRSRLQREQNARDHQKALDARKDANDYRIQRQGKRAFPSGSLTATPAPKPDLPTRESFLASAEVNPHPQGGHVVTGPGLPAEGLHTAATGTPTAAKLVAYSKVRAGTTKALGLLAPVGIAAAMMLGAKEARAEGKGTGAQLKEAGKEGAKAGATMAGFGVAQTGLTLALVKKAGLSVAKAVPAASAVMMVGNAGYEAIRAARAGASTAEIAKAAARGAWDMSLPGMVVNTGLAVKEAVTPLDAKAVAPTARDAAESQYHAANTAYQAMQATKSEDSRRGWANPKVQKAAQEARGRTYTGPGA